MAHESDSLKQGLASYLESRPTKNPRQCVTCHSPFRQEIRQAIEAYLAGKIKALSARAIHEYLIEQGYEYKYSTLVRHLQNCDGDLWRKVQDRRRYA